jgi:nucleoside 2-deoxyribosyltransferase
MRIVAMRLFLAGIMQGSHLGSVLHNQSYRERLKKLLAEYLAGAEIYDPLADHQNSLGYDDAKGREVFMHHNAMCRAVDAVIAFVPEASMGTAIEMWEAFQCGRAVITISPLGHNWAVRFLSHAVYRDEEAFEAALAQGEVARVIAEVMARR